MKMFVLLSLCIAVVYLYGCEDRYRYQCQNPENFNIPACSKPRCEFDQTCPDYLVAPVLEKKIGDAKTNR